MTKNHREQHIVVLGAGYTGVMAAVRVAHRTRPTRRGRRRGDPTVTVTLVNPSSRFTERLRMHQIATAQPLDQTERDLVATHVASRGGLSHSPAASQSLRADP